MKREGEFLDKNKMKFERKLEIAEKDLRTINQEWIDEQRVNQIWLDEKHREEIRKNVLNACKYLFTIVLAILTYRTTQNIDFAICSVFEMLIIASVSNVLCNKHVHLGRIVNNIFMLILNIQLIVLFFGNSFIQLVMLTNLSSVEDLSEKSLPYGIGIALVIVFSFLPISYVNVKWQNFSYQLLAIVLTLELSFVCVSGNSYSPLYAYYDLAVQNMNQQNEKKVIDSLDNVTNEFLQNEIENYREKDAMIPDHPNVILIFAEGTSQHIIDDERNITPNLAQFQKECLRADGYFNHTFATYRGVSGQLYSGYQLDNLDENNLVSMQELFKECGYNTAYINSEPANAQFTQYVTDFGFDEVIGDIEMNREGATNSLSDKQVYNLLWDTAQDKENAGNPFFISTYTYGTHVACTSSDEVYGDGSDEFLSKFYNMDYQFGEFIKKFNASELSKDTVIVFTTDHATYADNDFMNSFPEYEVPGFGIDEIPLYIYFKGMEPEVIEAEGRNSLDMAPTVFDFVDIDGVNYFLGTTLFAQKQNNNSFDTVYVSEDVYYDSDQGTVSEVSEGKLSVVKYEIRKYYAAKKQVRK